jgi:hypothetical protein
MPRPIFGHKNTSPIIGRRLNKDKHLKVSGLAIVMIKAFTLILIFK